MRGTVEDLLSGLQYVALMELFLDLKEQEPEEIVLLDRYLGRFRLSHGPLRLLPPGDSRLRVAFGQDGRRCLIGAVPFLQRQGVTES